MSRLIDLYLEETKEGRIIVKAAIMNIYIPVDYFDSGLSTFLGGVVNTIGSFYVGFKATDTSEEKLMKLDLPTIITINYSDQVKLSKKIEDEEDDYYVLTLFKDEEFVSSTNKLVSLEDAQKYLDYLNQGKLPSNIPYNEIVDMLKANMELNQISLPIPSGLLELMVGEMCRYKKDLAVPYRRVAGRTGNLKDYKMLNIKQLPKLNSVFAGLSFENINEAIISGLDITKNNRPQNISNVERIIYS